MRFWVHADKHLYLGISWRPKPARAVGFGPEYAAEACLARADRASVLGRSGDHGNHAPGRQEQADGVAMAAALPRGGRRWPVAGPAAGSRQAGLGRRGDIAGVDEDAGRQAAEGDPLEPSHDGQGGGHRPQQRAADLGQTWIEAAPCFHLQGLERPQVGGEGSRRGRPLSEPAGQGAGVFDGREEPDPGARPHPTRAADEEGPRRHHDPITSAMARPRCSRR